METASAPTATAQSMLSKLQQRLHDNTASASAPAASASTSTSVSSEAATTTTTTTTSTANGSSLGSSSSSVGADATWTQQLDLHNESAFPSLSSTSSKPTAASSSAGASWLSKSSPAMAPPASSVMNSAASKNSGSSASSRQAIERFNIPLHALAKTQGQLGSKSFAPGEVCKSIEKKTNTTIELSVSKKSGVLTVIIYGANDRAVSTARREVQCALCVQVTTTISVPHSARAHIVGAGGKNLKYITSKTMTKINMGRQPESSPTSSSPDSTSAEDKPDTDVVISGDYEGVEEAKREIESIVAARLSKSTAKFPIDRSLLPFLSGPNNSQIDTLMLETDVKIHIPPIFIRDGDSKNSDEIIIVGLKENVAVAEQRLKELYERVRSTTRTLALPVNKRQHRFIIGSKGATIQEILNTTGCYVELPPVSDPSDVVTIRGHDTNLSRALTLVVEKANSTTIEEIDVSTLVPSSTDPILFLRYVFTKHRTNIKSIESTHSVTISQTTLASGHTILEIQGSNASYTLNSKVELTAFLAGIAGTYFFGIAEVSRNLHKFLIGKNGNNIAKIKAIEDWQDRLVDIVVPSENGDSEDIIVVVKKPNNPSPSTDKECSTLIEKGRAHIIAFASGLADFVTKIVSVDAKYHGRLIGSGGEKLKEILGSHINAVSVKFPHGHEKDKGGTDALENGHTNGNASDPSAIVIKGPSKDVMEVSDKISKAVAEYRHTEVMNSFEQTVKVAKGVGKRLLNGAGLGGSGIGWLLKAVKEGLAAKADRHHPNFPAADSNGHLGLKVDLDESGTTNDIIKLTGPKLTAEIAKKLLEERGVELADLVDIEVKPFENLSLDAMKSLSETDEETKLKILRRVIGKDKRNVKKLSAKFNVFVKFVDQKDVDGEKEADFVQGSFSIRGSSKESELARLELVQAIENEILSSHSTSFVIVKECLPHVVGRGGSMITKIKNEFDVRIDLVDSTTEDGEEIVTAMVEGTKLGCEGAKERILEMVDEMVNTETLVIQIPFYLHKHVIGPSGSRINAIIEQFGGADKIKVKFRSQSLLSEGESADDVTIKAHKDTIPKVKLEIERLVQSVGGGGSGGGDSADEVSEQIVRIPRKDVSRVVESGGKGLKEIMGKFNVNIWIIDVDEKAEDGSLVSDVRIVGSGSGKEADVEAAKEIVLSKLRCSESIFIPESVSARLKEKGLTRDTEMAFIQEVFKKIRSEIGGVYPEIASTSNEVVVRGEKKKVALAKIEIVKQLDVLASFVKTIRISVPVNIQPHIIGKGGSIINKIRSDCGCYADLIRGKVSSRDDGTLVLRGDENSVALGEKLVNDIVSDQVARQQRDRQQQEAVIARQAAAAAAAAASSTTNTTSFTQGGSSSSERNSSNSRETAARVDDPDAFGGEQAPRVIPGWSGSSKKSKNVPAAIPTISPSVNDSGASSGILLQAGASKKGDTQWQSVKGKKSGNNTSNDVKTTVKAEVNGDVHSVHESSLPAQKGNEKPLTVVGAAPTATAAVTVTDSSVVHVKSGGKPNGLVSNQLAVSSATRPPLPPPSLPPQISSSPPPKKQLQPAVATATSTSTTTTSTAITTPSKTLDTLSNSSHIVARKPLANDGWQTVNTAKKHTKTSRTPPSSTSADAMNNFGSHALAAVAAALGIEGAESSGSTKKKKKKNKKKKIVNGEVDEDGDD